MQTDAKTGNSQSQISFEALHLFLKDNIKTRQSSLLRSRLFQKCRRSIAWGNNIKCIYRNFFCFCFYFLCFNVQQEGWRGQFCDMNFLVFFWLQSWLLPSNEGACPRITGVLHSIVMTPTQEVTVDHVFQSHTGSSRSLYCNRLLFVSFFKELKDVIIWRFEVGV